MISGLQSYDFDRTEKISSVEVYWWDERRINAHCRTPQSWRLLYKSGDEWKLVSSPTDDTTKLDTFNRVTFDPIETKAIRLEVQLQPEWLDNGGVARRRSVGGSAILQLRDVVLRQQTIGYPDAPELVIPENRRDVVKRTLLLLTGFSALLVTLSYQCSAQERTSKSDDAPPIRPVVPGTLRLHQRSREESAPKSGMFRVVEREVDWKVAETAIIICDMWDDHSCQMSAHRVDVMAPEMNRTVSAARSLGVQIIHAPSDGMPHYAAAPQRLRILRAPSATPPIKIESVCLLDPKSEPEYPIPNTTTVEAGCDDPVYGGNYPTSRRQHPGIKIVGYDGISDSGVEIYNFFQQAGIKNVVLMGVHTHHCVLGRSFGIRQMVRLGRNVVLCRDLTDAMYDPRQPPHVSHARGTELVVEHIEKYWCPSIVSSNLMTTAPETASE